MNRKIVVAPRRRARGNWSAIGHSEPQVSSGMSFARHFAADPAGPVIELRGRDVAGVPSQCGFIVHNVKTTPHRTSTSHGREQIDGVPRILVLGKVRSILDAFSQRAPELTMAELVARTGLPTSTCIRLVRNLEYDGLLEGSGNRYRIGLAIVRWASLALAGRSLVGLATSTIEWLRDETGESAQLCVREQKLGVVVAVANSHHSVVRQLRVGEVHYLHAGSVGKTFLAFDPAALELIRGGKLEAFTPRTVTNRAALTRELEEIRQRGYAVSIEERNSGAAGVTAPIFDDTGSQAGSVGVTGPINRMTPEGIEKHIRAVLEASKRITQQLGHV